MAALPGALPLLGHAPLFARKPLDFLASLSAHGDLVRLKLGTETAYAVCHPTLVHQLLVADRTFDKGGPIYDKLREFGGNGLGTCPAAAHRSQRRRIQPAFHRDRMPGHALVMAQEIAALTSPWQNGQFLDVPAAMHQLTTAVTVRCLFDADTDRSGFPTVQSSIDALATGVTRRLMWPVPLIHRLPTPANRRYERARLHLRQITDALISDFRSARAGVGENLMSVLTAPDANGVYLSDAEVHDQVISFLLAGVESAANALSWAWHLIGTHPGVQTRLHTEVDTVLADRPAGLTDLESLELTGRIVTETLRLFPPDSLATRSTSTDTVLGGHPLPAGTTVIYSPYQLHRRGDLYPDPDRFDPDRWQDIGKPPPGTWVPFGGGPRKCIADTFSRILTTLTLATVATRWQLRPAPGQTVRPARQVVVAPHTLSMRLHRRRTDTHQGTAT
ncbi:cytochrome P450 [Streptomyces sp. NBC_01314]|uniref:cytochrome P450 n=1 Tax=Streptomyces sp. NBC_01314 TaxID=2903821 RepID=UPI003090EE1D|nr:cytochrome P450 [Streptomyces sp. NBC_01314]